MDLREKIAKTLYERLRGVGAKWPPTPSNAKKWLAHADALLEIEDIGLKMEERDS